MSETSNFRIEETEDAYRAYFFPNARDGCLYKFQKYQVMYGWKGDLPIPKWLDYYKKYYTKEDAEEYASKINECKICMWIANLERAITEITGKPTIVLFEDFKDKEKHGRKRKRKSGIESRSNTDMPYL